MKPNRSAERQTADAPEQFPHAMLSAYGRIPSPAFLSSQPVKEIREPWAFSFRVLSVHIHNFPGYLPYDFEVLTYCFVCFHLVNFSLEL